jgi:hypothetical protein
MSHDGMAPRPLGGRDAAALIGVAAVLEGHVVAGDLAPHVLDSLVRHFHGAGLVGAEAGPAELRLAPADLNQRLRYALGEHDEPPAPGTGAADVLFGFASEAAAAAFAGAVGAEGEVVATPVPVDGRSYDGDVGCQVTVRTAEPPLSSGFDAHLQRLLASAAVHGGTYGGWGARRLRSVPGGLSGS